LHHIVGGQRFHSASARVVFELCEGLYDQVAQHLKLNVVCDPLRSMARKKPKAKSTMGAAQSMGSLISLFEGLNAPRVERTRDDLFAEILFLVLSAVVSGVNVLTEVERFGQAKTEWLRLILPYSSGIPSHDTIGRVLGMLDSDELERMFVSWMTVTAKEVEGVVALDGKAVRHAIARGDKQSFIRAHGQCVLECEFHGSWTG